VVASRRRTPGSASRGITASAWFGCEASPIQTSRKNETGKCSRATCSRASSSRRATARRVTQINRSLSSSATRLSGDSSGSASTRTQSKLSVKRRIHCRRRPSPGQRLNVKCAQSSAGCSQRCRRSAADWHSIAEIQASSALASDFKIAMRFSRCVQACARSATSVRRPTPAAADQNVITFPAMAGHLPSVEGRRSMVHVRVRPPEWTLRVYPTEQSVSDRVVPRGRGPEEEIPNPRVVWIFVPRDRDSPPTPAPTQITVGCRELPERFPGFQK